MAVRFIEDVCELQLGHAFSRVETVPAVAFVLSVSKLQLGHAFSRVETRLRWARGAGRSQTSIGPRVLTRGNI